MSSYKKQSGSIVLHYGFDEQSLEYWYEVYDLNRKHIDEGFIEGNSSSHGLTPILMAEKMKQFEVPEHLVNNVILLKPI